MAAGQFITAKLMRSNHQTPWGFRLQGGQEFQIPLSIAKISDGSLASQAGVQVGDIILKINGIEADQMRHKDAQDAIINAGNCLELYLERGPMNTWRPQVTPIGSIDIRPNQYQTIEQQTYTKTSLAKNPEDHSNIGSGHNVTAKPFGGQPKLVHKQFNSPINLYSEKSLEETLNAHSQVLSSGATGINFMKPDAPINKESAVFQMVQEEEMRKAKGLSGSPENGFYDGGNDGGGPIRHVSAPSGGPRGGPTMNAGGSKNICAHCERLIVGVFVKVNEKCLHAECFVCATCGTSLKNVGYFNINNKLYCDIHARQLKSVLSENGNYPAQPPIQPQPIRASPHRSPELGRSNFASTNISGQHLAPPRITEIPVQVDSYQTSTTTTTTNKVNGFQNYSNQPQSYQQTPSMKPFNAPPIAPKPNFMSNPNRNSMFVNPTTSYSYTSTETHSTDKKDFNYPPPDQPSMNPAANFVSPQLSRRNLAPASALNRPKSCYSSFAPADYSVTTKTYETRTTTNYRDDNLPGTNTYNANFAYPPNTANFASSQTTSYTMRPHQQSTIDPGTAPQSSSYSAPGIGSQPTALPDRSHPYPSSQPQYPMPVVNQSATSTTTYGGKQQMATADSRSIPKRGKGFLQNQMTGGTIPYCGYCNQQIRGQYIMAMNRTWCPDHFVCANTLCKRSLEENGFVEEQGRLYCEKCFEIHFAPGCAKCNQRIKGDCLNALGKQWHPACFTCTHCRKPFGNSSFYLEDSFPYCETDWNNLFTTKCVGCGYPIAAGDRWVEALNQNFHSNCFRCTVCGNQLEGQSFYAKGGRPYCKSHAR
ncbi:PDZ and LIM domain protein Zasp [Sarcoptes scabiei]|uniref:PDZ and LIM domain protein Zasp n=1 Tax=Sarcoptes scabiei TaxID=52283 RepID=A0A834VB62_SARSC|nr:PDZ and LIM domain protein Zasp [Sarcoptes scabiei]